MKRLILTSALLAGLLAALPARACQMALMFGIDVSGSINADEWRLQTSGLADALHDPEVKALILALRPRLSAYQWSGNGQQDLTLDWTRITTAGELDAFSQAIATMPRRWSTGKTAIGSALQGMAAAFTGAADCERKVIDLSGDGVRNIGPAAESARPALDRFGIIVNGLAIEPRDINEYKGFKSLDLYYRTRVIHGPGAFVQSANGYQDYPRAIRLKLLSELTKPVS